MYTKSFAEIFFPAGTTTELPLDFLSKRHGSTGRSIILPAYNREAEVYTINTPGYIMVPTFDFGYSDKTAEEAIAGSVKKLKDCALKVMLKAAELNACIAYGRTKQEIEDYAVKLWKAYRLPYSQFKPYAFEYKQGQWLVSDNDSQNLVIVIRKHVDAYKDGTGEYYSLADMGFACLDHRFVIEGRTRG